jgi:peptide/nickel transport system permease protein
MVTTAQRLIVGRLGNTILIMVIVSVIIFLLTGLLPSDAAQQALGQAATPEALAALRHQYGLDQPNFIRYWSWLTGVMNGDFGTSLSSGLPVSEMVRNRLPNSLVLAAVTTAVSLPVALTLGILCAIRRGSFIDRVVNLTCLSAVAVPEFLVATIAVLIFAVKLQWLPALSFMPQQFTVEAFFRAFTLPVITLCCVIVAQMVRMTRAAMLEQLDSTYVEMAWLKGASQGRTAFFHVLPNALGPIANVVAMSLSYLFGGVVIVESIFNYPGLASLMVDAVTNRDMALVQACILVFCAAYLILLFIADLIQILSNPRLRNK